jgi:S1-C subfamily serine protease
VLPASLKDVTARMNDRNKHKVTGQMNHQTADPKAIASVFLFFPTAHFLKTILASRTNGTFGFARHTNQPFAKPKEPFFAKPASRTINYSNNIMSKMLKQIKLIQLLAFVVMFFNFFATNAQTTNFYGSNKVQSSGFTGALYEVKIDRNKGFTYVTIQQVPTRNMSRMNSVTPSFNTKIKSGNYEAEYLGVLQNDGTMRKSSCSDNWGWNNVKTGESSYFITYVFNGAIPPGLTDFSLIDEGSYSGCRGYGFSNYTLNNPDNHPKTGLTEYTLKQKVDEQNDGIVGIYEPFDKSGYKLGCIKDGQTYKLVYLSYGETYMNWWKVGDVKATLRPSATTGVFKGDWYMADKSINTDTYIFFDGTTLKSVINKGSETEEMSYLKMYPTGSGSISSGSPKSSGTGFAISSNGYIVTNYHVIENAKSIEVKGINGNFTRKLSAKVVVSDERNDLAIIKIEDSRFTTLGNIPYNFRKGVADVGENIFVLGYPLTTTMGEEVKLTNGIVSSRTGFKGDISLYQISAPVQPGNSGGPLFDKNGNLLGVINAKHSYAENAGYAIKVSYLISLMDLLPVNINQPSVNSLNGKSLTEQVKIASNFTYIIVVNDK